MSSAPRRRLALTYPLPRFCPLEKNRLRYSRERALQNLATTGKCSNKRDAQAGFPDAPGAGSPGRPVPASRPPQARGPEEKRVGRLGAASRGKLPPSVKKEKCMNSWRGVSPSSAKMHERNNQISPEVWMMYGVFFVKRPSIPDLARST